MKMDKERVYISTQLACMLPPTALKVLSYLISWQSQEQIKYFDKQFSKAMHLDKAEIEQALQLLIDKELINARKIDTYWVFELEKKKIQSYFNVPMQKVYDHEGFKLPPQITWNKENTKSEDINDMSDDEMKRMILMLQARLNEKEQAKKVVVSASKNKTEDVIDDLPW